MFMPLGTDVKGGALPVANFLIIGLTVAAFLGIGSAESLPEDYPLVLSRDTPAGILGHIWLHVGLFHLVGNMFFLGVFGAAVCSRVGNFWYPLLYMGFGVAAGLAHMATDTHPAVGASGAVAGIMGMYAVLFPDSRMRIMWMFFIAGGTVRVPATLAILAWFLLNVYGAVKITEGIAYWAHVGGFIAGFVTAVYVLRKGWVRMLKGERTLATLLGDLPPQPARKQSGSPKPASAAVRKIAPKPASADPGFQPWEPTDDRIRTRCACGTPLAFPPEQAGKPAQCPRCRQFLLVPQRRGDSAAKG